MRLVQDEAFAITIETGGMDTFLDYWEELPVFASHKTNLATGKRLLLRSARAATDPRGAAGTIRGMSPGRVHPLTADAVQCPTLHIVG